ncbi:hypothetical protein [Nostoc sp.]
MSAIAFPFPLRIGRAIANQITLPNTVSKRLVNSTGAMPAVQEAYASVSVKITCLKKDLKIR